MTKIITHGGDAHVDDFLSCCLILSKDKDITSINRRDPNDDEIQNSDVWVIDIGETLDPYTHTFDHHQRDWEECSLSLLLKYWNAWEDAIKTHKWLETMVLLDSRGITNVSRMTNIPKGAFSRLDSFIERTLMSIFESMEYLDSSHWLFSLMKKIGDLFFSQIIEYKMAIDFVKKKAIFKNIGGIPVIQCIEKLNGLSSSMIVRAMDEYRREKFEYGGICIYPNNRTKNAISVRRYDDDARIDFRNLKAGSDGIVWVHKSGFFMILENMSEYEMEQIIKEGIKK